MSSAALSARERSGTFKSWPELARTSRALIVSSLALGTAGCSTILGAPAPILDRDQEIEAITRAMDSEALATCLGVGSRTGLAAPAPSEDPLTCRNRIVTARMYAIDLRYTEFELKFFGQNRWGGFAATVAAIGLGIGGSLSGAEAARALAAVSTGLAGSRAAYEREILAERTALALQSAMQSGRDRIGARIRTNLRQGVAEYPLGVALSDLDAYFRAGTLQGALSELTQTAGREAAQAQEELARATGFARSSPSQFLQRTLSAATTPAERTTAITRIRAAMTKLGIATGGASVTNFITDERRVAEHASIARELGWTP